MRGQEGMIVGDIRARRRGGGGRGGKGESLDITLTRDLVTCIPAAEICTQLLVAYPRVWKGHQDGLPVLRHVRWCVDVLKSSWVQFLWSVLGRVGFQWNSFWS